MHKPDKSRITVVCTKLKEVLKERKFTLLEMFLQSDVHMCDISSVSNGKKPIYPGFRAQLSRALKMTEEELFPEFYERMAKLDESGT